MSSHNRSFKWTDDILKGIEDSFAKQDIQLTADFLDTERQLDPAYKSAILNLLAVKYRQVPYDLVITSGNNASTFFITHGRQIFRDIPHIFCGTNILEKPMIQDQTPGTGITAKMDVYRNLQLIGRLHPDCKKIVVIADNSAAGKSIQSQIHEIITYSEPDIPIEIWNNFTIRELEKNLILLPESSVILYGIFYRDKNGVFLGPEDSIRMITQLSPVPVYGGYDFSLGSGIVGGYLIRGIDQGEAAGDLALQILKNNVPPRNLPIIMENKGTPEFDWRALSAFRISPKKLPQDSRIYFSPAPFYYKYKYLIFIFIVAVFVVFLLWVGSLFSLARSKKSEKELQIQTNALKTIVNSSQEAIIHLDDEWNVLRLNPIAATLTGWPQQEGKGRNLKEIFHIIDPETGYPIDNMMEDSCESNETPALLRRRTLVSRDSMEYQITYSFHCIESSEAINGAILLFRDVTEEYGMIEMFQKKEAMHKTLFNATSNGIFLIERETGYCLDVNQAAVNIIEMSIDEIKGLHIQNIAPAIMNKWEATPPPGANALDLGQLVYHTQNKHRKILHAFMTSIDDRIIALLIHDRTQQLELERQIRQSQKHEALGTLAGGIAHDFNNILTSLFAYTSLLKMDVSDPDAVKKHLGQIDNGLKRATDLVGQILTFSRQNNDNDDNKIEFKIHHIVKDAVKFLRSSIPSSIQIKSDINSKENILGDPSQIHQILMNLCVNAYHAMGENPGVLTITLDNITITHEQHLYPGNYVRLRVKDTGQGIPEDIIPKIFDPFFTTKKAGEGTGLGLSVVDGIVKDHNGRITVTSEEGRGSEFVVFLPVSETKGTAAEQIHGSKTPALLKDNHSKPRILVVDDEQDILLPIKTFLDQNGLPTTTAEDPLLAMKNFIEDPKSIDLVILDLIMPNMHGLQFAEHIRHIRPDIKIILLTGFMDANYQAQAEQQGIEIILEKPISPQELLSHVQKAVAS